MILHFIVILFCPSKFLRIIKLSFGSEFYDLSKTYSQTWIQQKDLSMATLLWLFQAIKRKLEHWQCYKTKFLDTQDVQSSIGSQVTRIAISLIQDEVSNFTHCFIYDVNLEVSLSVINATISCHSPSHHYNETVDVKVLHRVIHETIHGQSLQVCAFSLTDFLRIWFLQFQCYKHPTMQSFSIVDRTHYLWR